MNYDNEIFGKTWLERMLNEMAQAFMQSCASIQADVSAAKAQREQAIRSANLAQKEYELQVEIFNRQSHKRQESPA